MEADPREVRTRFEAVASVAHPAAPACSRNVAFGLWENQQSGHPFHVEATPAVLENLIFWILIPSDGTS